MPAADLEATPVFDLDASLRAARTAMHDGPEEALPAIRAAVGAAIEAGQPSELEDLAQLAVEAARDGDRPEDGLAILGEILRTLPFERTGGVLVRRASLWGYQRRYDRRSLDLRRAAGAYAASGDAEGECRALSDLALPVGTEMSLPQRIEVGTQALEMARGLANLELSSVCAANVAVTMFFAGDRSALALRPFIEANAPGRADTPECRIVVRNWNNWATGAVAFGLLDEVERAKRVVAVAPDSMRKRRLSVAEAVVRWRRGEWDAAHRQCESLATEPLNPEDLATLQVIRGAIDFQRRPMMKPNGLTAAADSVRYEDPWGAIARAVVIDVRLDRREPRPVRGLLPLIQHVHAMGIRVGWEDLLPAAARASAEAYRQMVAILRDSPPLGVRAEACGLAAEGWAQLRESPANAARLLEDGGEAFEALREPFEAARCFEGAAVGRNRAGRHAGALWRRAAGTYRELTADRALAGLLRRSHGTKALEGFSTPATYRRVPAAGLTRREQEVADLLRRGHTSVAIAERLTLSQHTVLTHMKNIRQKLQVGSKNELIQLLSED